MHKDAAYRQPVALAGCLFPNLSCVSTANRPCGFETIIHQ